MKKKINSYEFYRAYFLSVFTSVLFIFSIFANTAQAAYSNDPNGEIFIKKPFADISNCGPLSALMLMKFADPLKTYPDVKKAIKDARITVQKEDADDVKYRWWNFNDIKNFLNYNSVNYTEIGTADVAFAQSRSSKIVSSLAKGSVVLINIDMNHLPSDSEIGKFYGTTSLFGPWGHYLVVVGYKLIDGQLAYEIHDSYSDKGKNRVFYAKNINKAIGKYNKNLLLVERQESSGDIFSSFFN